VQAFLVEFSRENGKNVKEILPEAMEALLAHHWPGNVRELRTSIEHAVVLCRGEKIGLRDLPASVRSQGDLTATSGSGASPPAPGLSVKDAEKDLITRALKECGGNRTEAAKRLGMSRRTLHRKLHTYHLEGFE
jgi:DNA-binding NtrC family response regulator